MTVREEIEKLAEDIHAVPLNERGAIDGLPEKRRDVIVGAALLMCAMQGIVLDGGSFGVFLEKAPGGQFWIASMVVILVSAAVGALTYALRKK